MVLTFFPVIPPLFLILFSRPPLVRLRENLHNANAAKIVGNSIWTKLASANASARGSLTLQSHPMARPAGTAATVHHSRPRSRECRASVYPRNSIGLHLEAPRRSPRYAPSHLAALISVLAALKSCSLACLHVGFKSAMSAKIRRQT